MLFYLLLLGSVCGLVYLYSIRNVGYWKRRGIKEAESWPFVGSFPSQFTMKRSLVYDVDEIYQQYKHDENFVGIFSGCLPQLLILSPELVHKVFVNDFRHFHDNEFTNFIDAKTDVISANNPFILKGQAWRERRADIVPGLTNNRIAAIYSVTQTVCGAFRCYLEEQSELHRSEGLNAKQLCLRYTADIVADCVLGIKALSFTDAPAPVYGMIRRAFQKSYLFFFCVAMANIAPALGKLYRAPFLPRDVSAFFIQLMQRAVDLRRQSPAQKGRLDFLNHMLELQEKKNLSVTDLTMHSMTVLVDGFETTASVLAHTLLLLGRNPAAQQYLRAEVGTSELSFEQLHELKYLEACLHETVRIFFPQMLARKLCTEAYEMTNKNGAKLTLQPGQVLWLPIYSLHHDSAIFEQAELYKPERFLEENGGVRKWRNMGAYLGFGDGPRACFGQRFAMTQMKAALVEILRTFDISVNAKTRDDNVLDDTYFVAELKGGVWLNFVRRK